MNHPGENSEAKLKNAQPETHDTAGGGLVEGMRSLSKNRIAALLLIASALGCGARSELKIDENGTSGVGGDSGTGGSDTGTGGTDTGGAGGEGGSPPLECNKVSVIFDGPAAVTVPKGATNVPVFCFHVKNGCVEGYLESMTVETTGVSDPSTVEFAFAYSDGSRLTEFQTGSSAEPSHTFHNIHLPLVADAENALVCLFANFSETAFPGGQYGFKYFPKKEDFSHAPALEGVPAMIEGNKFTLGGVTTGATEIHPSSIPLISLNSGENGKIAAIEIIESGTSDGQLKRLSLHIAGTCDPKYITNFALYQGSTVVCAAGEVNPGLNLVHLTCASPFTLAEATAHNFEVTADQTCPPGTTIQTYLSHPSDLYVMDSTYGFGQRVSGYNGTPGESSIVDIK